MAFALLCLLALVAASDDPANDLENVLVRGQAQFFDESITADDLDTKRNVYYQPRPVLTCPVTPTLEATECKMAGKSAAYVDSLLTRTLAKSVAATSTLDLIKCLTTHLLQLDYTITLYCYFRGLTSRLYAQAELMYSYDPSALATLISALEDQKNAATTSTLQAFYTEMYLKVKGLLSASG